MTRGSDLTPKQKRALEIIRKNPGIRPREFAKLMWPDSPRWRNMAKCGYGVHQGGGMYLAAGGFMGKLNKLGLIHLKGEMGLEKYYISGASV